MKIFLCSVFCCLLSAVLLAAEPQYPSYTGFVNDYAGVFDAATKDKLESLCRELEQKTSAEMAIAVVKLVAPLDSKTYAVKLFEKWKIGKKNKDNGLLILLAMEDRRVEIEVGYGLEGVINDAKAGAILDKYVVPFFKEQRFGEGLYNGALVIADQIAKSAGQELSGESRPVLPQRGSEEKTNDWLFTVVVIAAIILISISGWVGGLIGAVIGAFVGFFLGGIIVAVIGAVIGFVVSYFNFLGLFMGGGGFGGFGGFGGGEGGGGFGGFGGGGSGGGGSGRSW